MPLNSATPVLSISATWPQVRAISFDLDDTLWPIRSVIENAETALWHWYQQNYPSVAEHHDVLSLRQHRAGIAERFPELAHSIVALRQQALRSLLVEFDYADDLDQAKDMAEPGWRVFYRARHQVEWFGDARPSLERLQAHYPLVAATNGNASLTELGVDHLFQAKISANDIGHAKPDAPIWNAVCDALNLMPAQILHVGDHPREDVLGAMRHGMPAVWLNRADQPWPESELPEISIVSLNQLQV